MVNRRKRLRIFGKVGYIVMYPPLSILGYIMRTTTRIDWLSITYPFAARLESILPKETEYTFHEIKSPIPVYKTAYQIEPIGAKLLIGDDRLGQHVIYSGQSMTNIYELEIPLSDIYDTVQKSHGHLTRIDLALDVFESELFTVDECRRMFNAGFCKTNFRKNKEINENDEPETFYFGKLNSRIAKCRVYNKALEQKIKDYKWVRIEYEKRKNADNWFKAFMEGRSIKSLIKSSVDFPQWRLWQEIFNQSESAKIPRIAENETGYDSLMKWILSSAIPAISKAIISEAETNDKFSIENSRTLSIINSALEYRLSKDLFAKKVASVSSKDIETAKDTDGGGVG